jgi:hypothetical protein
MAKFRARAGDLIKLPDLVDELAAAISDMTAPDPRRRGHPRDRIAKTSSYDVRRYVSLFNRLTLAAEYRLRKE